MEPRARVGRHKANLNFGPELSQLLYAYGAPTHPDLLAPHSSGNNSSSNSSQQYLSSLPTPNTHSRPTPFTQPYPETLRVLDEIVTDFIIETCHNAVAVASYSGRAKLKLADFEWTLRRDATKLGRVQEMFKKKRDIDTKRRLFNTNEGTEGTKMAVGDMIELGGVVGEEGTGKGKGRGRGRRRKRGERNDGDGDEVGGKENGVNGGDGSGGGLLDLDDEDADLDEPPSKRAKSEVD